MQRLPVTYDHASDVQPRDSKPDTTTRPECAAPALSRQAKDESDVQEEDSHAVIPSATEEVILYGCIPLPIIVKLKQPLETTFTVRRTEKDPISNDKTADEDPGTEPNDMDKRLDRIAPPLALSDAAVSDTHVVPSHTVPPTDTASECRARPALLPITVTLTDPVAAKLILLAELATGPSADIAAVTVPTRPPILADTRTLVCAMLLALQTTDVSASHVVKSHTVQPCRTPALMPNRPCPAPCIVIRAEPVPAVFAPLVALTPCVATDSPLVSVPDLPPAVSTVRPLLSLVDPAARHAIAVSDSHVDRSHAVATPRALALD